MKFLIFPCVLSVMFFGLCRQASADDNVKSVKYTKEEISKLKKFREMAGSMSDSDYLKTDGYLIRWLRAGELNLDSAKEMLEKALKWRAADNISTILQENLGPGNSFYIPINAFDKYGRPVILVEIKKMDTRKYVVGGNAKLFGRTWSQIYERMEDKIYQSELSSGKPLGQGVLILDMSDYNLRQHACIACLPVYFDDVRSFESYYPGIFDSIFFINAPRIFSPLLELLKPIMSSQTRNALHVFGSNQAEWQPKLHEQISPDQLPINLGGTKTKF